MSSFFQTEDSFKDAVVLMVDDEPLVMDMLETCLEENGYRFIIKIEDSREAVKAINEHRPDVVLLDLKMPHIDGFEILQKLRSAAETQFLSVIILTSSDNSETKLRALELGATDFLAKPIDPSEMLLRMRNTLTVKAYQDKLAYYDTLTKLPNRRLFLNRLERTVEYAEKAESQLAVLNVAIDRFQQVNELLGPQAGDQLLEELGQRLSYCLRDSDLVSRESSSKARNVARLSGDEFSILLIDLPSLESTIPIAERIQNSLKKPFNLSGKDLFVTVSIGVASYPEDATTPEELMSRASAAMSYAKKMGRNCYQFFSSEVNAIAQRRITLEQDLRRVVEQNELYLEYQPKVSLKDNKVIGVEALLRWKSPERGNVPPFEFIPIAEECGIISEIGRWVLFESMHQAALWRSQGLNLELSVNVSANQFIDNQFPYVVQQALKDTDVPPENLIIEITEGVLIGEKERIGDMLFKLKMTGAQVSVDDFGTGYSSLSYLKSFPIDELKIDRSFIIDVPEDSDSSAIVRAIIAMAKSLDLKIVAEGVEEKEQLDFLMKNHCDVVQGFYFAKPLPADDVLTFCKRRKLK